MGCLGMRKSKVSTCEAENQASKDPTMTSLWHYNQRDQQPSHMEAEVAVVTPSQHIKMTITSAAEDAEDMTLVGRKFVFHAWRPSPALVSGRSHAKRAETFSES